MKKIIFIALLIVGVNYLAQAQFKIGVKGGLNVSSEYFVTSEFVESTDPLVAYHLGAFIGIEYN